MKTSDFPLTDSNLCHHKDGDYRDNFFYVSPDFSRDLEKQLAESNALIARMVSYLADLNGSNWIPGNGHGEIDMRQRAKALQSIGYSHLNNP
jgi:hypothetical protein